VKQSRTFQGRSEVPRSRVHNECQKHKNIFFDESRVAYTPGACVGTAIWRMLQAGVDARRVKHATSTQLPGYEHTHDHLHRIHRVNRSVGHLIRKRFDQQPGNEIRMATPTETQGTPTSPVGTLGDQDNTQPFAYIQRMHQRGDLSLEASIGVNTFKQVASAQLQTAILQLDALQHCNIALLSECNRQVPAAQAVATFVSVCSLSSVWKGFIFTAWLMHAFPRLRTSPLFQGCATCRIVACTAHSSLPSKEDL
jgi:hypothetical protein